MVFLSFTQRITGIKYFISIICLVEWQTYTWTCKKPWQWHLKSCEINYYSWLGLNTSPKAKHTNLHWCIEMDSSDRGCLFPPQLYSIDFHQQLKPGMGKMGHNSAAVLSWVLLSRARNQSSVKMRAERENQQPTYPPAGLPPPLLTIIVASTSLSCKAYRYIFPSRWCVHVCNPALREDAHI